MTQVWKKIAKDKVAFIKHCDTLFEELTTDEAKILTIKLKSLKETI